MSAYYYAYGTLGVLLMAFIPGIIAAEKEHRFSRWYLYGILLFPVAFIHSLLLKKPIHKINVITHDKKNPAKRKVSSYRTVPAEKKQIVISPKYLYMVFFSKLIFGGFVALSVFAVFRTFVQGTESLRLACSAFAVAFSVLLSVVEICRYSRLPLIADEITKRALITIFYSIICSLPVFLIEKLILDNIIPANYQDFIRFICIVLSFAIFTALLLKKQQFYYSVFSRFTDYCLLSVFAYAIFAAISLIWMSISGINHLIYAVAMPTQIFNMEYFSDVEIIENLSYIYSSALVHLCIALLLIFSGLMCKRYKRSEIEARIEYRSKAFRMSRKRILRRHIRVMGKEEVIPIRQ